MSVNCAEIITNAAGLWCLMIKRNIITAGCSALWVTPPLCSMRRFFCQARASSFFFFWCSLALLRKTGLTLQWCLKYEGRSNIGGPGRAWAEWCPGLDGRGKVPVATEGRGLVCKHWRYKVTLPLVRGCKNVVWAARGETEKEREAGTTRHSFSNEYKNLTAEQHLFPHNPKT